MAHSPGYPTDNNSWPDRKERSREKQRDICDVAVETKTRRAYVSTTCILNYSNTQYNNCFNLTTRGTGFQEKWCPWGYHHVFGTRHPTTIISPLESIVVKRSRRMVWLGIMYSVANQWVQIMNYQLNILCKKRNVLEGSWAFRHIMTSTRYSNIHGGTSILLNLYH